MIPPALLIAPAETPGQPDAKDASGRQDAIPKGVAEDFDRALRERDEIIARLRLALDKRDRLVRALLRILEHA